MDESDDKMIGKRYQIKTKDGKVRVNSILKFEHISGHKVIVLSDGECIFINDVTNCEEIKPEPEIIRYRSKKHKKKPEKEFCNYCGKELDKNDPEYKYNPYGSAGLFCCLEHFYKKVNEEWDKKEKEHNERTAKKKC